jgi:histone deacetylase 11
MRIVYQEAYNYGVWGTQWLHPFDQRKFARIWRTLQRTCGTRLADVLVRPQRPVNAEELLAVHSAAHLASLKRPAVVAAALEIPLLAWFPPWLIDRLVLRPMRWQTMGTVVAAGEALACGLAVNLGGGFHHARRELAHGFSIYSDIILAVESLRGNGRLGSADRVAYIDLDAHHGDGVASLVANDPRVFLFDMYNREGFPHDTQTPRRVDCNLPLAAGTGGREYLSVLRGNLPGFLDSISRGSQLRLAIYNAGTDVFERDPIGNLRLTADDILARDLYVLGQLESRRIPAVMLLAGGYTRESYRLVAGTIQRLLEMAD